MSCFERPDISSRGLIMLMTRLQRWHWGRIPTGKGELCSLSGRRKTAEIPTEQGR